MQAGEIIEIQIPLIVSVRGHIGHFVWPSNIE